MTRGMGYPVGVSLIAALCLHSCSANSGTPGCVDATEMVLDQDSAASHLEEVVEPAYPRSAPRQGIPLAVELELRVDAEGRICAVEIISGHRSLVEPAKEAARRWKFRRFFLDFKPVPAAVRVTITFDPQRRQEVHRTLLPRRSSDSGAKTTENRRQTPPELRGMQGNRFASADCLRVKFL